MIRIGAALSEAPGAVDATREAAETARAQLGEAPVDLAFLFLSPAHLDDAEGAADAAHETLEPGHLLGCVAEGVLAGPRELEEGPAAAVWAGSLPGANIETFHAETLETGDGVAVAGFPPLPGAALVTLLADPFTFPVAAILARLNEDVPGMPVVGGLAVGGPEPGAQALFMDREIHEAGAVGAVLRDVAVEVAVSQGCAPIGRDAVVTRAAGNVVYELAGEPALDRLRSEILALPAARQALATRGLLAGIVIDENKPTYERGDYLMRGLLGADDEAGALAIGERVRVGQTLRFHIRDAGSADEDLRAALDRSLRGRVAAGALLFTCNGRGTSMFPAPDHDARAVSEALGSEAVAGFFCGGEIGPVGGRSFLHGFTATLAIFHDG